jgi:predicted DCC family thiol-disulfide oxidoreductase YuxK
MNRLYVMYDSHCGLCTEVRDWLETQPAYLDIRVLASGSDEARLKFPGLPAGELAVVSDRGEVWLGDHAFIVCLWALRDYRTWSHRLASPLLCPMARQAFEAVSHNRKNISQLFRLKSEAELRKHLSEVTIPPCPTQ